MQIASGKEAPFNASYSSGVGSYTSSGTNFNPASPNSNLKLVSPTPHLHHQQHHLHHQHHYKLAGMINGGGNGNPNNVSCGRPSSYTSFQQSPNVEIKNSLYSAYDIPNTDKLGSPLVHNELLAQEVRRLIINIFFFYFF